MNQPVELNWDKATSAQIEEHLLRCEADFVPRLSERVDLGDYARKLFNEATRAEAWSGSELVGLVAFYCNDESKRAIFVTNVSVLSAWRHNKLAARLMVECIGFANRSGFQHIDLEVACSNAPAVRLYQKLGFTTRETKGSLFAMSLQID